MTTRACPVDLHYPEPDVPNLDLAAIVRHGTRIRRRRWLAGAGAVLAACVAAGTVIAGAHDFTAGVFPAQSATSAAPGAAPIDAQVAEDPPVNGRLTLISSWPAHWTTVAWATRDGDVCFATFRTPIQGVTGDVECPAWDRSAVLRSRSGALNSLYPDVAPMVSSVHAFPVLGLTSPQAVRVVLAAFGKDIGAHVVPVATGPGETVGVFLAWIRAPGDNFDTNEVTSEAAYDRSGHVIARASYPP
jgi:hypothetical protein